MKLFNAKEMADVALNPSADTRLYVKIIRTILDTATLGGVSCVVDITDESASAARAIGGITLDYFPTFVGNETITINGVVLTNGVQWTGYSGNHEATVYSITNAINVATATTLVSASADSTTTISLKANTVGIAGNAITLATSSSQIHMSGSTLSGGLDASSSLSGYMVKLIVRELKCSGYDVVGGINPVSLTIRWA